MAAPEAKLKQLQPADRAAGVGARSDLVVTIGRRSDRRLIACGDKFLYERLPDGTRVIYPPPPLDELPDVDRAVRYALLRPENTDPLFAQLEPNMRVTVAIDDISVPCPQMRQPDLRAYILNKVAQTLADYGVDDVHLILATGLNRKMTETEIRRVVGDKVFIQFWPDRLYNFDAEDRSQLSMLGKTDEGEPVWLSKRAADSDLLVCVGISGSRPKAESIALGLTPYVAPEHYPDGVIGDRTNGRTERANGVVLQHLKVFAIQAALNTRMYGPALNFLHKNEDRFTEWDRGRLRAFDWALSNLSKDFRRHAERLYASPYGATGVWAGDPKRVNQKAVARVYQQHCVPVDGQSDILIVGIPDLGPYTVNSVMNPVLVEGAAVGDLLNAHRGKPLLRTGGTLIVCHPLRDQFHPDHHPSYIEFFHRCLSESRISSELAPRFEPEFARNPTYLHMYRYGHAFHGVHPFRMWARGEVTRGQVGRVIAAGCEEPQIASRLGWEAAQTLDQAIAMATSEHGRSATIAYLHAPPSVIVDVK